MIAGTKKVASKKKTRDEGISEADLRYLEERRKVGRRKKQAVRTERGREALVPVSTRRRSPRWDISSSGASSELSSDSEMELEAASRKREASGDEQQRGAKKQSTQ